MAKHQHKNHTARLRVCASCEWVWKRESNEVEDCPRCGFGSYGAHYVYGDKAYRYVKTNEKWLEGRVRHLEDKLRRLHGLVTPEEYSRRRHRRRSVVPEQED